MFEEEIEVDPFKAYALHLTYLNWVCDYTPEQISSYMAQHLKEIYSGNKTK